MSDPNWLNRTMWTGDNLEIMRGMNSEAVDLIYLDPPFNSNRDYAAPIGSQAAGAAFRDTWTLDDVDVAWLGPGSTVSHDALRLLAHARTALAAVGADGVRLYTAPPLIPDRSGLARAQARMWADDNSRLTVARRMYAWRLGEVFPHRSLDVLRGIEGARMKESYRLLARQIGVQWSGRHYDRAQPQSADLPNQAINHASSAVEGAAAIAVASTGTIPQLGFIHEDPGQSFVLDIADLYRDALTIPCAFRSAKRTAEQPEENIERVTRRLTGKALAHEQIIPAMIARIKSLFVEQTEKE